MPGGTPKIARRRRRIGAAQILGNSDGYGSSEHAQRMFALKLVVRESARDVQLRIPALLAGPRLP